MTLLLATLLISTQTATPSGRPTPAPTSAAPPAQTAPTAAPNAAPAPRIRTPVLAQGALIASAAGFVAPSASDPGLMVFILDERLLGNVRRTLTMLPSDPADDVKAMTAAPTPDTPWRFEVSGQVYDYHGRAFLLPVAIVSLRNPPVPAYLSKVEPPDLAATPAPPEPKRAPLLDAYMDHEALVVPMRDGDAAMTHERGLAAIAATDESFAAELERRLAKGVKDPTGGKLPEAIVDRTMVMPAGVRLQDRRAAVTRDPITGAWRAVLEAAPMPGAPLAMELLPCRELQKVERSVKSAAVGTPWLLSGEVVVSGERNYLLLSLARELPKDRWIFR